MSELEVQIFKMQAEGELPLVVKYLKQLEAERGRLRDQLDKLTHLFNAMQAEKVKMEDARRFVEAENGRLQKLVDERGGSFGMV